MMDDNMARLWRTLGERDELKREIADAWRVAESAGHQRVTGTEEIGVALGEFAHALKQTEAERDAANKRADELAEDARSNFASAAKYKERAEKAEARAKDAVDYSIALQRLIERTAGGDVDGHCKKEAAPHHYEIALRTAARVKELEAQLAEARAELSTEADWLRDIAEGDSVPGDELFLRVSNNMRRLVERTAPKPALTPEQRTEAIFDKWGGTLERLADGAKPEQAKQEPAPKYCKTCMGAKKVWLRENDNHLRPCLDPAGCADCFMCQACKGTGETQESTEGEQGSGTAPDVSAGQKLADVAASPPLSSDAVVISRAEYEALHSLRRETESVFMWRLDPDAKGLHHIGTHVVQRLYGLALEAAESEAK